MNRKLMLARLTESGVDAELVALILKIYDGACGLDGRADDRDELQDKDLWLKAIVVRNFRGVGNTTSLGFVPGPGLTLVVGPNGSAKSSFAEGLELALTGHVRRASLENDAKHGLVNLQKPDSEPVELTVDLVMARDGSTVTLASELKPGLTKASEFVSDTSGGTDARGLQALANQFRPLLASSDATRLRQGSKAEVHDDIAAVLNVADLKKAKDMAAARKKEAGRAEQEQRDQIDRFEATLATWEDVDESEVAAYVRAGEFGLARKKLLEAPEYQKLREERTALERIASFADAMVDSSAVLIAARLNLASYREDGWDLLADHTALLRQALQWRTKVSNETCPVCSTDALDAAWLLKTEAVLEDMGERSSLWAEAEGRAASAEQTITAGIAELRKLGAALGKGSELVEEFAGLENLTSLDSPSNIELSGSKIGALAEGCLSALAEPGAELGDRVGVLADLSAIEVRHGQLAQSESASRLGDCETTLNRIINEVMEERFDEIEEQALDNWSYLRRNSSVELSSMEMRSQGGNLRRFDVEAQVDGESRSALAVMSNGEVNAVALSIFLPRATSAASPFRFVVLDDPVQSLDDWKVDGLAALLNNHAQNHQIIIFTHDRRLVDAVRRRSSAFRCIELNRRAGGKVEVSDFSPVEQTLDEARSFARDRNVDISARRQAVAAMCRGALEAQVVDLYLAGHSGDGHPPTFDEKSERVASADLTWQKLDLLIIGRITSDAQSKRELPRRHSRLVSTLNQRSHEGETYEPEGLVKETRELISYLTDEYASS